MEIFKRKLVLCLFLFIFFTLSDNARAEVSFSIEPPLVRLILPSPGVKSGILKVYTRAGKKVRVKVYTGDWKYTDVQNSARGFFPSKTTPFSCADWITFSPAEFVIPPYGTGQINYSVNVPAGMQGGHYAALFAETAVVNDETRVGAYTEQGHTGVTLNIRLAVLFFVEVKDTVKRMLDLNKFSISKGPKGKYMLLESDFKNIGNGDIRSQGDFHIISKEGKIFARGKFNDASSLPGDAGKLSATWKESLPKGQYSLVTTLRLGKIGEEAGIAKGPAITKEAEIEIGDNGEIVRVGEFK